MNCFSILCFILFQTLFTINSLPISYITLQSFHTDVTGNHVKEHIRLEGEPFTKNHHYYHRIRIHVESSEGTNWTIPLANGYHPKLYVLDINNDQIDDLFYQTFVNKNEENQSIEQGISTLKDGEIEEITLPKQLTIYATLLNDNKIKLFTELDEPFLVQQLDQNHPYLEQHYDETGKIHSNSTLYVNKQLVFEPLWIHRYNQYGLVSTQSIKDEVSDRIIGELKLLWIYKDSKWEIIEKAWQHHDTL